MSDLSKMFISFMFDLLLNFKNTSSNDVLPTV